MPRFITAKLESDSELESDLESKSDTGLMAKLESNSFYPQFSCFNIH